MRLNLWLPRMIHDLTRVLPSLVVLHVDNKSALELMKNPVFHRTSKHIDTLYHLIRECVERGGIVVRHVHVVLRQNKV